VADIEASCSGVAVLNHGRVVYSGTPQALTAKAEGRVWQVEIPTDTWPAVEARFPILASRVYDGHMQVRLLATETPPGEAQPLRPGLEDGYVAVMKGMTAREVRHA
jgi:ABC-2 type transport system ATP-binding protein